MTLDDAAPGQTAQPDASLPESPQPAQPQSSLAPAATEPDIFGQAAPAPAAAVTTPLTPAQKRERAACLAENTDPASPLYPVYLADYFGASPNIISFAADRFGNRFLWDRYQDALQKEQLGQPMSAFQSKLIGRPVHETPPSQQGDASSPVQDVMGAAAGTVKPVPSQSVVHPQLAAYGAPVVGGTMAEQRAQHSDNPEEDKTQPGLTLGEFNQFAKLARAQELQPKSGEGKQQAANPAEQKQLLEMQQRLGVKQTGRYDNATRHALQAGFIDMLRPYAVEAERKFGIPAAVTIAQAIIESGYGVHIPTDVKTGERSNNLFGIKPDKEGQAFVTSWTKEYNKHSKQLENKLQPFSAYDDFGGSVDEHSEFLKRNSNYKSLFSTTDPEKWADGLQDAHYAGDNPKYAGALKNAMRMWKLIK